jgi:hypothetical protein
VKFNKDQAKESGKSTGCLILGMGLGHASKQFVPTQYESYVAWGKLLAGFAAPGFTKNKGAVAIAQGAAVGAAFELIHGYKSKMPANVQGMITKYLPGGMNGLGNLDTRAVYSYEEATALDAGRQIARLQMTGGDFGTEFGQESQKANKLKAL